MFPVSRVRSAWLNGLVVCGVCESVCCDVGVLVGARVGCNWAKSSWFDAGKELIIHRIKPASTRVIVLNVVLTCPARFVFGYDYANIRRCPLLSKSHFLAYKGPGTFVLTIRTTNLKLI